MPKITQSNPIPIGRSEAQYVTEPVEVTKEVPAAKPVWIRLPKPELKKYIDRLLTDEWMRQRICDRRKEYGGEMWNPNTMLTLAQEGSIGWAGDLLFALQQGVLSRSRWRCLDSCE